MRETNWISARAIRVFDLLFSSVNVGAVYDHVSCVADGSIASVRKRRSPALQQDGNSEGGKRMRYLPVLPEDIWWLIHSLMPMRDAA